MSQYYQNEDRAYFTSPRITWAVQRLILVNIGIFALQVILRPVDLAVVSVWGPLSFGGGATLEGWFGFDVGLFLRGMIWQPFTYQFLHGGLMHLFMNMLWLFFFGPDVERALGTRQFFRFYIICGAVGVLASLLPLALFGERAVVIGASGAVMGVLVAFAILDPERQFFLFPLPFPVNARALVLIVVVFNVIAGMGNSPISVVTHFGGMGTGYVYMRLLPKFSAWQRQRRRAAANGPESKSGIDKLGDAVDNIFKFERKRRR
jgi:membrane associated rhomboid family serine protease